MAEPWSVAWMFDKKDGEFIAKFPATLTPSEEDIVKFFAALDENDDV